MKVFKNIARLLFGAKPLSPYHHQLHDPDTPEANYRVQMERCYICAAYERKLVQMQLEINEKNKLIASLSRRLFFHELTEMAMQGKNYYEQEFEVGDEL